MSNAPSFLESWPLLVSLAHVAAAAAVTVDAVLRKRHVQSIFGWVGLAWLAPFIGAVAYLFFGINRIRRAAAALHLESASLPRAPGVQTGAVLAGAAGALSPALAGLDRLGQRVTGKPLYAGNRVEPLENGDVAFPRMLAAIGSAQHSISLQSYIFDSDEVGSSTARPDSPAA